MLEAFATAKIHNASQLAWVLQILVLLCTHAVVAWTGLIDTRTPQVFIESTNAYAVWRHKPLQNISIRRPSVGSGAFIAPSATLVGRVEVGQKANIWYGAVLRGDKGTIKIGDNTNLQDGVLIRSVRATPGNKGIGSDIGSNVTIGHGAILNGVTIEDEAFIGIGAVLQQGVTIEKGAMVAAGAVVEAGKTVPKGEVWGGNPAKYMRSLKSEESEFILPSAQKYVELAEQHRVTVET